MQRTIKTEHKLLTNDWTSEVEALVTAIRGFGAKQTLTNDCRVVLFEVAHDSDLHVNVTHSHETKSVRGWAGPGSVPEGFVSNRTFGDVTSRRIAGHIREMVFAERV
jgi:hypothetical protein